MRNDRATSIASLYHIANTKILLLRVRRNRAARAIARQYRLMRLRVQAKSQLARLKAIHKGHTFRESRVEAWLLTVWRAWNRHVSSERARKGLIAERVEQGLATWIAEKAKRLQRFCHATMAKRKHATEQLSTHLDPAVLHTLHALSSKMDSTRTGKRDLCFAFYQQALQDASAWEAPNEHLYRLAHRYQLQLEAFPIKKIRVWLKDKQQSPTTGRGGVFVDLHTPFPIRTLEFLAQLSTYYALSDRVVRQSKQIWIRYEAKTVVREYLALLYAHNQVLFSPVTTYSAQLRQQAVKLLEGKDEADYMDHSESSSVSFAKKAAASKRPSPRPRSPFTSFHCLWNDLCEKCLALQPTFSSEVDENGDNAQERQHQRVCSCCGHHHHQKSTAANLSYAAFAKKTAKHQNGLPVAAANPISDTFALPNTRELFCEQERCDFLVTNAFFHALAPFEHEHRKQHSADVLWKLAMANAYTPVTILYEQCQISSLNSLLGAIAVHSDGSSSSPSPAWESYLPPPVLEKLVLFAKLLNEELRQVDQELRLVTS